VTYDGRLVPLRRTWLVLTALAGCGRYGFQPPHDTGLAGDVPAGSSDAPRGDGPGIDAAPPPGCGDGVVGAGEQCDDGNLNAGDGCSPVCALEDQGPGATCAAPRALTLVPTASGHAATATGDTTTGSNSAQVSCTSANTLDQVFSVTVAAPVTLNIVLTPSTAWNTALAVRDAALACSQSTTICCVDAGGAGVAETSACAVPAGTVMIVVDSGGMNQAGPYTLTIGAP